ncbi:P-loop NTPase fold protein [Phormidium tenue]|uniref:NTPase n=1 Tax=Phormidium tenue FACHB-1050 TaxID=2692857 RepID=A0ABR8C8F3_9CYAN|nr:P-loop NTPase fold protein [Phormidium tenue]MBD2316445.1 NTPase [Phormidium tenue FACHB-1050]
MSPDNQSLNDHIDKYLEYYCNLSHSPSFAVLLKGQWGSGKTWFINKYREILKKENQKCLYVSLYGMTSFSEIEDAFLQQLLHPILTSKGVAVGFKIFKSLLKGTLKIDLDGDGKDDGNLSIQIPEINLLEQFKDINNSILIFDDLERCKIDLSNLLGYINYFVEHQGLKVILIADEDKLENNPDYPSIKEKLIGKTFAISADFDSALKNFIEVVNYKEVEKFLSESTILIKEIYKQAKYENLRNLKQIILDFDRIFAVLLQKAKNNPEILQDILQSLMAFSIEIKRGDMSPKDITKLEDVYISKLTEETNLQQSFNPTNNQSDTKLTKLQQSLGRYTSINLYDPLPSRQWWEVFFDKGIIDEKELNQSILNRYFQNKNTANWIRLWHYSDVSDDEFNNLLNEVVLEFSNRKYNEIGIIKHVVGLLLVFSDAELYDKSKEEIIRDSKLYIDYLKNNSPNVLTSPSTIGDVVGMYAGLGFQGKEIDEFKELLSYISNIKEIAREEGMSSACEELLNIMQNDSTKFRRMVSLSESRDGDTVEKRYYETPIFKYINPTIFIEKLLSMNLEDQRDILWTLSERYRYNNINENLVEDLKFLKSIQELLQVEITDRRKHKKVSGFVLEQYVNHYLDKAIDYLDSAIKRLKNEVAI